MEKLFLSDSHDGFEEGHERGAGSGVPETPGGIRITDIKIRKAVRDKPLRALVSVTLNGELAVHDIKVICGKERLFVAMPSRMDEKGRFRDILHPITAEARRVIEESILDAYRACLEENPERICPEEPHGQDQIEG